MKASAKEATRKDVTISVSTYFTLLCVSDWVVPAEWKALISKPFAFQTRQIDVGRAVKSRRRLDPTVTGTRVPTRDVNISMKRIADSCRLSCRELGGWVSAHFHELVPPSLSIPLFSAAILGPCDHRTLGAAWHLGVCALAI